MTTADAARECLVEAVGSSLRASIVWAECIAEKAGRIPPKLRRRLNNLKKQADKLEAELKQGDKP